MRTTFLSLPIVLVGLPGAGKIRVGCLTAQSPGVAHIDTGRPIEEEAGCLISTIFAQEGEVGFRECEVQAVEHALKMRAIISLGGGVVTLPRVHKLLKNVDVVWIGVEHEEFLRRVTRKNRRPPLRENPDGVLLKLRGEREPYYREVEAVTLPSDGDPALEVAKHPLGLIDTHRSTIHVRGSTPYDVLIARGIITEAILEVLRPQAAKVLLVHVSPVKEAAWEVARGSHAQGLEVHLASHPGGEAAKSLNVVAGLWGLMGRIALGRTDAPVAIGGGTTTDMVGFVATTWFRGTDPVTVPTAPLAMVDATIGGKMGINTVAGKNLVGSFYPPRRVLCDLDFLSSLPERDFRAGMAETLKCGFVSGEKILTTVEEAEPDTLIDPASPELRELLRWTTGAKARVASEDLKESGLREILNYGHTFTYAVEHCEDYTWCHSEVVVVGRVPAIYLAQLRGLLSREGVMCHTRILSKMGLPTSYEGTMPGGLKDVTASDKKIRQGRMRFIPPEGIACPEAFQVEPSELDEPTGQIGIHS